MHSTRTSKLQPYLVDYNCFSSSTTSQNPSKHIPHPLSYVLTYDHFSSIYKNLCCPISSHIEQKSSLRQTNLIVRGMPWLLNHRLLLSTKLGQFLIYHIERFPLDVIGSIHLNIILMDVLTGMRLG